MASELTIGELSARSGVGRGLLTLVLGHSNRVALRRVRLSRTRVAPLGAASSRDVTCGAASTGFTTPPRDLLEQPFGPGRGLSAQSHALGPRIIHVSELAHSDARFREVHPEVSFRAMNDRRPLPNGKKSARGALERIELLRRHGIELVGLGPGRMVPLDDVLDAAAAAWSAHRIALGTAESLPDPPEMIDGRAVAIWY